MNWALRLVLIAASAYALSGCVLYLLQDHLLYMRTPEVAHPGTKALRIESGTATLKVWELHGDTHPAIIYFGGNGEDVGANIPDFDTAFAESAVYLVNYRGYGGSTGRPSEAALIADALTVYDSVSAQHAPIAIIGRSLGTGVAVALAAERPVERLILVTPYDSIANVAADHYRLLPVRSMVRDRYDSAARIRQVTAPTLVVIAENDEVVYRPRTDALLAAMTPALRHTLLLPGATHNDVQLNPLYYPALRDFLYRAP